MKLWIANQTLLPLALNYSQKFGLPLANEIYPTVLTEYHLLLKSTGLFLMPPSSHQNAPSFKPIHIDFNDVNHQSRSFFGCPQRSLLAKAIGYHRNKSPLHVLDCTAGFGQDAYLIASLGYSVTLIERSPFMAALLYDGIQRAKINSLTLKISTRLHCVYGDSLNYLQLLPPKSFPDIIYLDPMFEKSKKAALPKKSMQILQALLSDDETNTIALLDASLKVAKKRVILKRPRHDHQRKKLNLPNPNMTYKGKAYRFDVYWV
jgi:16S rRNA (guanine1516-N2)-methyltransferase